MKLTVIFLSFVILIAVTAIYESVKKLFNNPDFADAMLRQHMNYIQCDYRFGAFR